MKKLLSFVFLATILFFITACGENHKSSNVSLNEYPSEEQEKKTNAITSEDYYSPSSDEDSYFVYIWRPYKGDIPKVDLQNLETVATREASGDILFRGSYYEALTIGDKLEMPYTSGWRVDLDSQDIVGKTSTDDMVLAQDLSSPTILCTVDALKEVTVYFRKDFAGLDAINLSEFDIFYKGNIIENRIFAEQVWRNHIQKPADLWGHPATTGIDPIRCYSLVLVHKEESAMCYELNFGIGNGNLYLKNPYVRFDHVVPMKDLLIDSIAAEKTGDRFCPDG